MAQNGHAVVSGQMSQPSKSFPTGSSVTAKSAQVAKRTPRSRLIASLLRVSDASARRSGAVSGSPLTNVALADRQDGFVSRVTLKIESEEYHGVRLEIPPAEPALAEPTPAEPTPAEPTPAEPTPAEPASPEPASPEPASPGPASDEAMTTVPAPECESSQALQSNPDVSAMSTTGHVKSARDLHIVNKPMSANPHKTTQNQRRQRKRFDPVAFDQAIYQQSQASRPPSNVILPTYRDTKRSAPSSEEKRLYIHANPAIHLTHNRSELWHRQKASDIRGRGGRKAWFGKVIERRRWLRHQGAAQRAHGGNSDPLQRPMPEPWQYSRPLDFGDVPESQLPEEILRNANWRRACAWHREVHQSRQQMRISRQRAARDSEQKTQQFYQNILQSIQPSSSSNNANGTRDI